MNPNYYYIEDNKNQIIFTGCKKCGYSKYHIDLKEIEEIDVEEFKNVEFSKHHYTCLCNLFESSIVCCSKGYKNMLLALPFISSCSSCPLFTAENIFLDGTDKLAISRTDHLKIKSEAINIKNEVTEKYDLNKETVKIKVKSN